MKCKLESCGRYFSDELQKIGWFKRREFCSKVCGVMYRNKLYKKAKEKKEKVFPKRNFF